MHITWTFNFLESIGIFLIAIVCIYFLFLIRKGIQIFWLNGKFKGKW